MKYLSIMTLLFVMQGCISYDVAKPVYKAGRTIVKEIPFSEAASEKLRTVDKVATTYDEARGVIVEEYKAGKSDANTSKASEK